MKSHIETPSGLAAPDTRKPRREGFRPCDHSLTIWDKGKKYSTSRQVCIGKLGPDGKVIYNKRFMAPEAREALEKGGRVSESVLLGQSLILA
ncbi:MAG: hypothetical protein LBR80_13260, partial [Deltaproteobacteria bacterium]|nr:hypothetical protein [Deltaproteobacteria bacterium]